MGSEDTSFKTLGCERDEKGGVVPGREVSEQRRAYAGVEGSWVGRKAEGKGQVEKEGLMGEGGGREREADSERE